MQTSTFQSNQDQGSVLTAVSNILTSQDITNSHIVSWLPISTKHFKEWRGEVKCSQTDSYLCTNACPSLL